VVDVDKKKLSSHDVIFMESCGMRHKPPNIEFPSQKPEQETAHIEEITDTLEPEANNARRRRIHSEVWGADTTRRSE